MFKMNEDEIEFLLGQRTNLKNSKDPAKDYYEECLNEYEKIALYLPKSGKFKLVDIGCGLGGISVIIQQQNPDATVIMYDKNGFTDQNSFRKDDVERFFNSNSFTTSFSSRNIKNPKSNLPVVLDDLSIVQGKVDVITSYLSMGYHYPVAVYGEFIKDKLKRNTGIMIIDQRRQVPLKTMTHVKVIGGSQKRLHRHVYRNNK